MKRVNVVVSEEQHQLLTALGRLQGRSAASYLREMLDSAEPMLQRALEVWTVAEDLRANQAGRVRQAVRSALEPLQTDLEELSELVRQVRAEGGGDGAK